MGGAEGLSYLKCSVGCNSRSLAETGHMPLIGWDLQVHFRKTIATPLSIDTA